MDRFIVGFEEIAGYLWERKAGAITVVAVLIFIGAVASGLNKFIIQENQRDARNQYCYEQGYYEHFKGKNGYFCYDGRKELALRILDIPASIWEAKDEE